MSSLYQVCEEIYDTGYYPEIIGANNIIIESIYDDNIITIDEDTYYGSSSHHNIVLVKSKEIVVNKLLTVAHPKKSLVLFCETLINNGTISMTGKGPNTTPHDYHICYVSDGIYQTDIIIPAYANNAAAAISGTYVAGRNGNNGTNRQCGSGGTGTLWSNNYSGGKYVGASGMGYAFGGGAGSGGETGTGSSAIHNVSTTMPMIGGAGYSYTYYAATGGVGQPAGANSALNTYWNYGISNPYINQQNIGVGGRIIIFCNEFINNGKIEANGINAVNSYIWGGASGGASGGGAIDIFYKILNTKGTVTANGGIGRIICDTQETNNKSGNGGNGSVTFSLMLNEIFVNPEEDDKEWSDLPIIISPASLKNTNIYKNPEEYKIFDLSKIGLITIINNQEIIQDKHYFQVGEAICYNIKEKRFALAVANNTIESEVVGLVSEVINENRFKIINTGFLSTDKYTFELGTQLYLSNSVPGKLVSIPPHNVIKPIATQTNNGIILDIKRGWIPENASDESNEIEYELYTEEELNEIISNIW